MDAIIEKLIKFIASKAGEKIAKQISDSLVKTNVTDAELKAFADSLDFVEVGINVVHDMTRDDKWAGSSTFNYLRGVADTHAPDGGFIAGMAIGLFTAFGGAGGKAYWTWRLAAWKTKGSFTAGKFTYTAFLPGSVAFEVANGASSRWENFKMSSYNSKYLPANATSWNPTKMAQIAKAVLAGQKIGIEAGMVLIKHKQVSQLASLINKPTPAVTKAKDVQIAPTSTNNWLGFVGKIPTPKRPEKTPAAPPPQPVDDGPPVALLALAAAGVYLATKKG